jgi:hypothetical protein
MRAGPGPKYTPSLAASAAEHAMGTTRTAPLLSYSVLDSRCRGIALSSKLLAQSRRVRCLTRSCLE